MYYFALIPGECILSFVKNFLYFPVSFLDIDFPLVYKKVAKWRLDAKKLYLRSLK
jgi:hypothetical protein